jgi:hypothetical protein
MTTNNCGLSVDDYENATDMLKGLLHHYFPNRTIYHAKPVETFIKKRLDML